MTILITGGAGFIGSNFVLDWLATCNEPVINVDKLTYAGNLSNLQSLQGDKRHLFIHGDIGDAASMLQWLRQYQPRAVINFAAESHVDRSIHDPEAFIQTNVNGTFHLLEAALAYWRDLPETKRDDFRFLHISTDEVYGSLDPRDPPFTELSRYAPNSPYAASKASSDHLVRAYYHTYGLPAIITNCSNNYGPYQFPEKLIPLAIHFALMEKPIPIYGDGQQIRDWIYVKDHCTALRCVLQKGLPGEVYNVGSCHEQSNLEVVETICARLDLERPRANQKSYQELITFVKDRPGHDRRYAIDASKIRRALGWAPKETFASGMQKTIAWYLENETWVQNVTTGRYRDWINTHYQAAS